jgi:hypothetical protein
MNTKMFDLVTLVFDLLIENFNLVYIFWLVGTRALTFHMSVPCDKKFPRVPNLYSLWGYTGIGLSVRLSVDAMVSGLYTVIFTT